MNNRRLVAVASLLCAWAASADTHAKTALFGDLHVHTRYSFDAFLFGTMTTPDDAYRFAKGDVIPHAGGFDIQLDRPLDFYAVTDHAFYLGMFSAWADPEHPDADDPGVLECVQASTPAERGVAFRSCFAVLAAKGREEDSRSAWQAIQDAAERHNDPGSFTTFIGYEYTSSRNGNLHRNVFYRGSDAPPLPFSRLDSLNPEDLWAWMDAQRNDSGIDAIAIPHNANGSNGNMFDLVKFAGEPLDDAYAEQRMRNEPLVEITQIKGTSDTHPFLSPNDEWADFEIFPYQIASWAKSRPQGSYVREAWLNGLAMEATDGFNPYRFGVVGASDTHNSGERFDEGKYVSKVGLLDSEPERRGSVPLAEGNGFREVYNRFFGASGLAGVWAPENTRAAIFDAFRRKETFATSGPRIKVRLLAGDFDDELADAPDLLVRASATGVPQGGELTAPDGSPAFLAWAAADPEGTRLQRLQIVKGWVEDDRSRERVYDVACADGLEVDAESHRCPDSAATVDLADCSTTPNVGAGELRALWRDPDYDADAHAFYYVRVLENPTCRWSTWDAVRAGTTPRADLPTTIQERAWTSPIWVVP